MSDASRTEGKVGTVGADSAEWRSADRMIVMRRVGRRRGPRMIAGPVSDASRRLAHQAGGAVGAGHSSVSMQTFKLLGNVRVAAGLCFCPSRGGPVLGDARVAAGLCFAAGRRAGSGG